MTTPSTPTSTMKEAALKPCPFCGGDAGVQNGPPELWYVECRNLDCLVDGAVVRSEAEAIAAWNRRSPVEAQPCAVAGPFTNEATFPTPLTNAPRTVSAVLPLKGEVPTAGGDSTCSDALRQQGKPYPRTCVKCGLGPCVAKRVVGEGAAAPSVEPTDAELDKVIAATKASYKPTAVSSIELQIARALLAAFARPLPGGVPTGLSDEQIEAVIERHVGGNEITDDEHRSMLQFARALLSAGAPSSLPMPAIEHDPVLQLMGNRCQCDRCRKDRKENAHG